MHDLIDWSRVDHVLLDMDGTLLDLAFDNHFWRELVAQRYAVRHGIKLEAAREPLTPKFRAMQGTLEWYCLDYWTDVTQMDIAALKEEIRDRIAPLQGAETFLRWLR